MSKKPRTVKPHEFDDASEIIKRLKARKESLEKYFYERRLPLHAIAKHSIGSNTYRAFRNLKVKPSTIFRQWVSSEFDNQKKLDCLLSISSQEEYDEWTDSLSERFRQTWTKQTGEILPYGPARKLPDLFMKGFMYWEELTERQRTTLLKLLHVPLDSFTLVGIRNCLTDPEIPPTATMKYVVGRTMYYQIQGAIRSVAKKAHVPPIFFDVLAWNDPH